MTIFPPPNGSPTKTQPRNPKVNFITFVSGPGPCSRKSRVSNPVDRAKSIKAAVEGKAYNAEEYVASKAKEATRSGTEMASSYTRPVVGNRKSVKNPMALLHALTQVERWGSAATRIEGKKIRFEDVCGWVWCCGVHLEQPMWRL